MTPLEILATEHAFHYLYLHNAMYFKTFYNYTITVMSPKKQPYKPSGQRYLCWRLEQTHTAPQPGLVVPVASLPSVIITTLKGSYRCPPFTFGETEVPSWLKSHSLKAGPGGSPGPGCLSEPSLQTERLALTTQLRSATASHPLTFPARSHAREPRSSLSLIRRAINPNGVVSQSIQTI